MARYDEGFGGPRGGWRGRQGGPYNRGFPESGGMPQGGRPGPGAYGGGDWSRESAPGGGRGPSFGGSSFGGGYGARPFGQGGYGGGNRGGGYDGGPVGRGWDRIEGSGYGADYRSDGRSEGPGTLGTGNRSGSGFGGGSGNRSGVGFGSGGRSGGGFLGGGSRAYGGGMTGGGSPGGWTYRAGMDRGGQYGAFDRGEYGGAYEEDSGYPGVPTRGEYYGAGRPSQQRGYDGGFAREPFMPEEAYRRHPEYRQEHRPRDWEAHQHDFGDDELSDDEIRDAVYGRMHADAWLEPDRIEVRVEDGVVTLTGEVDDFLKARYAWDDAWEADGVRGVVNNLTVRADEPRREPHGDVVTQSGGERTSPDDPGAMS
jgi:hypothetical protein